MSKKVLVDKGPQEQVSLNRFVRGLRIQGGIAFGAGCLLLKVPVAAIRSEVSWLPAFLTEGGFAAVGLAIALLGAAAVVTSFSVHGVKVASRIVHRKLFSIFVGEEQFELYVLEPADLAGIYPTFRSIFGEELLPQSQVADWMAKNPMIAYEVLRVETKGKKVKHERIGFFELLPLTKSGEQKLRRDDPQTADLRKGDIHAATRWGMATGYYVASVGVVDPANILREKRRGLLRKKQEGVVMKLLKERLAFLSANRTIEVYARPVTDDGLRLVKDYKFRKRQSHLTDTRAIWSGEVSMGAELSDAANS